MSRLKGRPTGYKMSKHSKNLISKSRTGQKHDEETIEKITSGVKKLHETGAPIDIIMDTDLNECGKFKNSKGYVIINIPNPIVGEPTYNQPYHVALIEKKLGRKLVGMEQIHHWGDKDNNNIRLLTLCKDRDEHYILDNIKDKIRKELFGEVKIIKKHMNKWKARPVIIHGMHFKSLKEASKILGFAIATIKRRIALKKEGYEYRRLI